MPFASRVRRCSPWAVFFVEAVVALAASNAKSAVYDPPSTTSHTNRISMTTTPTGLSWTAVSTGTALPVRTSATSSFNGAPGAVVYFNYYTGQLQVDPKGHNLSSVIITFTTGTVNISSSTPGPFTYATGTSASAYSPLTGTPRTLPAKDPTTAGLAPVTFASRVGLGVGPPQWPLLSSTGDLGNIASTGTSGFWNMGWSFPLDLVASGSVESMAISNFKTIGQNSQANANILGYGLGACTFQYGINGVTGTQVGAVVPTFLPEPSTYAITLAGLACGGYSLWRRRMRFNRASKAATSLALSAVFFCATNAHAQLAIDWVTVGDPGNAPDTTGYGAVPYEYQIGKYEVTNDQYAVFLNAVAATDIYNLRPGGGITVSGTWGAYTYAVNPNMGDKPVIGVDWFDAARMANWLQNGQGGPGTTETGAYTLNGDTSGTSAPARNAGALVFIPTENEWYKAAYYRGGNVGYWQYATQSDLTPSPVAADATGVGSAGDTGNYSNYNSAATWGGRSKVTSVGTNGQASHYGVFDMNGNAREWNDSDGGVKKGVWLRGGSYLSDAASLSSSSRQPFSVSFGSTYIGIRLAAVPEPSTSASLVAGMAFGGLVMWQRRKSA